MKVCKCEHKERKLKKGGKVKKGKMPKKFSVMSGDMSPSG